MTRRRYERRTMSVFVIAAITATTSVGIGWPARGVVAAPTTIAAYEMNEVVGSTVLVDGGGGGLDGTIGSEVVAGSSTGGATFHRFAQWQATMHCQCNAQHLSHAPQSGLTVFAHGGQPRGVMQDFP